MGRCRDALIWALFVCCTASQGSGLTAGKATAGDDSEGKSSGSAKRRLQGRFLHITDFHPDPFYKTYSSTEQDAACHRKRGPAGYFGAETSACDSSVSLVNATMEWIKHNVADQVDFVVWTGDSARHDNDEKIPRTQRQIIEQNEFMVNKFTEVFGDKKDGFKVPIVPTFGNNDIMPHNILLAGPNKWTTRYLNVWRNMIPETQRHQFQQGGWYWVEVVTNKLAVISLNTMYFFNSNSGVDGCANKHEPGYEQFEWLRVQLQIMRDRGVSAILIGHVPPARVNSKESWEETCWQKYALWKRQYRDVIVASLFGHMNMDHFMLQDFKQIKKSTNKGKMATKRISNREASGGLLEDGEVTVASSTDYLLDLRKKWSKLPSPESKKGKGSIMDVDVDEEERENPIWKAIVNMLSKPKKGGKGDEKPHQRKTYLDKIGGQYAERYSVSLVSPSVVPNYFPTLRILEYNITGLEDALIMPVVSNTSPQTPHYSSDQQQLLTTDSDLLDDSANNREVETAVKKKQKDKQKSSLKKPRKYKFTLPKPPSKSSPPGPAYSPQPLTLLGYTQYFANLTYINNDFVEDTDATSPSPFSPHTIFGLAVDADGEVESRGWKEGKHGKYQGKKPRPEPHPNKFEYEVEYDTKTDERWGLKDLTVRRWVEMARRIGGKVEKAKASDAFKQDEREEEEKEEEEDEGYESAESDELEKDEQDDEDEDEHEERHVNPLTTKGKKHKHKKKHGKNSAWYMFVSRAFVGTMDPREIEEVFGAQEEEHTAGLRDEVIEL